MLGSDKHNKGVRTIARLLRDEGVEVVYLGEYNTAQSIASAVIDEDVDLLGISAFTGNYVLKVEELMSALKAAGASDVPVMLGGLIHSDDFPALYAAGVQAIFGPRSGRDDVMNYIHEKQAALSPTV
jgi:methylmalonyl-CoA mutase C-terminal domain/subunit